MKTSKTTKPASECADCGGRYLHDGPNGQQFWRHEPDCAHATAEKYNPANDDPEPRMIERVYTVPAEPGESMHDVFERVSRHVSMRGMTPLSNPHDVTGVSRPRRIEIRDPDGVLHVLYEFFVLASEDTKTFEASCPPSWVTRPFTDEDGAYFNRKISKTSEEH